VFYIHTQINIQKYNINIQKYNKYGTFTDASSNLNLAPGATRNFMWGFHRKGNVGHPQWLPLCHRIAAMHQRWQTNK